MSIILNQRQKIAIIGSGISGLGVAYLLAPHHDIKVYEKNDYLGIAVQSMYLRLKVISR